MFPRGVVTAVRPFQTILLCLFFAAPGALVGCGGGQAQMREQMDTLRIEMRELSDSQQALVQKNENLKNRLELLEDKQAGVDLRRSMRNRTALPVVRVQPKRTPRNEPSPLGDYSIRFGPRIATASIAEIILPPEDSARHSTTTYRSASR